MWGYGSRSPFWYTTYFWGGKKSHLRRVSLSQKSLKNMLHFAAEQKVFGIQIETQQRTGSPDVPAAPIYPLISEQQHRKLTGQKQDICHLSFVWVHGLKVGKYLMSSFPGWNDTQNRRIHIYLCTHGCLHIHRGKCIKSSRAWRENACRHLYGQLQFTGYKRHMYMCHL